MILKRLLSLLTGDVLGRVFDTIDKNVEAKTDREAIKADIIKKHYETRADFMQAGGFVLMMLFAVPLAVWFAAVCIYSVLWCAGCAYPQEWTVAALPAPLDQWAALMIVAVFGVSGVTRFAKK